MAPAHDVNKQTGIDMINARNASPVDVVKIRYFLHHGEGEWNTRKAVVDILSNDPVFDKYKRHFMDRTQQFNHGLAMTNHVYKLEEIHGWSKEETNVAFTSLGEQLGIGLHRVAFEPVFLLQSSAALRAQYAPEIATHGILGCYLQTELGHGTNVQSLETTATYIPQTQEFEIHSPTLTSAKWWIGALGKMATHGVVQARLILPGGKDVGPHLFFVQLRSLENHSTLPGITVGDIGPKVLGGFALTDNGFARFSHVRIPKEHMLSKFAQVTDDGKYIQPPHAKLSYSGMLYIRSGMVTAAGWQIAKAATISIRYATVRRQGEKDIKTGIERQIITYPSVYYRLLPILSRAYIFVKLGRALIESFRTLVTQLSSGDTSFLGEMHAITSGLKVLCTTLSVNDIEQARRSMGGHGYSAFSGLSNVYADYLPSVTYEGDNFVLDQQVVRAALKAYKALFSSQSQTPPELAPSSRYLRLLTTSQSSLPASGFINTPSEWLDYRNAILILERRAALMVQNYASRIAETAASKADPIDTDPNVKQRISRAVTEAFVAQKVGEMIEDFSVNGKYTLGFGLGEHEVRVLKELHLLYLLTTVESAILDILTFSLLPPLSPSSNSSTPQDPTLPLRTSISSLCQNLLPHTILLTDSFGFTDWELNSALGVSNGKVYEKLWECAQGEPLNDPNERRGYEESIKPILLRGQTQAQSSMDGMYGKQRAKL